MAGDTQRLGWLGFADRTVATLLILGAAGHTAGAFSVYGHEPVTLLWALCASVLIVLVGVLNILRSVRPRDLALAWVAMGATFAWLAISFAFGVLIGDPFDFRPLTFEVLSLALLAFCVVTVMEARGAFRRR